MTRRNCAPRSLLSALCLLTWLGLAGSALAQNAPVEKPRPMYKVLPAHLHPAIAPPAASLRSWNGSFTFQGTTYPYNMVGASSNTTATITAYIIPVKIVITNRNGTKTSFDPSHVLSNGNTVTTNTIKSPLFDSTTTYIQGGVNVGGRSTSTPSSARISGARFRRIRIRTCC